VRQRHSISMMFSNRRFKTPFKITSMLETICDAPYSAKYFQQVWLEVPNFDSEFQSGK
jgi:hypothetical protein